MGFESNKVWLGIPKYTSRNDIGKVQHWPLFCDDRAILTMVLKGGEYTSPILFTNEVGWHSNLPYKNESMEKLMEDVIFGIKNPYIVYYTPHDWSPAIRIELPFYIANDEEKLEGTIHNIKSHCLINYN